MALAVGVGVDDGRRTGVAAVVGDEVGMGDPVGPGAGPQPDTTTLAAHAKVNARTTHRGPRSMRFMPSILGTPHRVPQQAIVAAVTRLPM